MRYTPVVRSFFSGLMLIICVMTKMAFCLFAGALVITSLLGFDVTHTSVVMTTVVSIAIVTAVFTMIGGFAGVAYADVIQSTIKILGCGLMLVIGLHQSRRLAELFWPKRR